jgi:hypothetical protein
MPFITGTVPAEDTTGTFREAGHQKLFRRFRRYITGSPEPGAITDPGAANTGNGVVKLFDTKPSGVAETWTFTCTTGGASAVFSVVGSVSGAQASLTINTNYENSHIAARIEGGSTAFVIGDDFQVTTTASTLSANDKWSIQASYDYFGLNGVNGAALGTPNHEIILKGVGLSGSDQIFVGIRVVGGPSDTIHNWEIKGFTGASPTNNFDSQPGASPSVFTAFWDQSMSFWFVVNGRRFIVVAKVSATYHSLYAGFILPYATPTEYPYPLLVVGEEDAATIYSSTAASFSFIADPEQNAARIRDNVGTWNGIDNGSTGYAIWPHDVFNTGRDVLAVLQVAPTGESPIFPCNVVNNASGGSAPFDQDVVGVMDGVFAVSGHNLSSETLLTISSVDHLVVQNIFRTSRENYMAIKLA